MEKTLAQAWAEKARQQAVEEAKPLLLPSGITVLARRPGPALLASYSRMPTGLAMIANGEEGGAAAADAGIESAKFLYDLLTTCVVSPVISTTGGVGTIHPKNLPDQDVTYIMGWALRGEEAARLATFRRERTDGNAGGNGEGIRTAAEHADGDRRSGAGAELRPGGGGGAVEKTF